jgi:predicted site-specific integrase-resolvase
MDGTKKKESSRYVTVGKASLLTGLDGQTIRKMADKASILCYRTPSGQRRIDIHSIQAMCSNSVSSQEKQPIQKQNFVYARVSTKKQLDDLSRQVKFLRGKPEYSNYICIEDIGSGINFKRKGLSTILDSCLQRTIGELVIAHRDRLCRFGYELIESLVIKSGGKITVLESNEDKTCEQELTEDLLSIIHVFSCRQMGKRSYANRKVKNSKDTNIPDTLPKDNIE